MRIGLIIWGLEGTLFSGSSERGSLGALIASRADRIRAFNDYGVASTICGDADTVQVRVRLEAADLWHELSLPRFDMALDADAVREVIGDFGMSASDVLLVHDDPCLLQAARALTPDLRILNASGDDADAILEALYVTRRRPWKTRSDIALLLGDQTKAVAHFSRLRARIDESVAARRFALSHMITGPMEDRPFPPRIVYDAGMDYGDARWPDLANLLDCEGLLEACIQMFCERVGADKARALVVLPSAGDLLIPTVQLRRRTIKFNAAWRDAAHRHAHIDIMDMPQGPPASALQARSLAAAIDDWAEGGAMRQVRAA